MYNLLENNKDTNYKVCNMAQIFPPFENIDRLKQVPTEGELFLLKHLARIFSNNQNIEIYYQPFINGTRPDIVILNKNTGVTIIEVKDWDLDNYYVNKENDWCLTYNGDKIKSPYSQVQKYKEDMFNLHINGILEIKIKNPKFYGRIKTYVYFHNSTENKIKALYQEYLKTQQELQKPIKDYFLNNLKYETITSDTLYKLSLPSLDNGHLFTPEIYDEFKRNLQPPFHIKDQGIDIKYTLQQQKFIESKIIHEKIRGSAGSGKTTILAKRAVNAHKCHNDMVLILTYNITLRNYIRDKISDVREDFDCNSFLIINYHEFIRQVANDLGIDICLNEEVKQQIYKAGSKELQDSILEAYYEKTYYSNLNIFDNYQDKIFQYQFQTILIDELQDYKPEWIKIIRKYFSPDEGEIVLYGDEKQNIYERETEEKKMTTIQGFGNWKSLGTSIRYLEKGGRIQDLAYKFQQAYFNEKYELDTKKKTLTTKSLDLGLFKVVNTINVEEISRKIILEMKQNDLHPNDVTILASRIKTLRDIEKNLRKEYHQPTICTFETDEIYKEQNNSQFQEIENIRRIKKLHFQLNDGSIKLSTIHSFKGFESPNIFLILHDFDNSEMIYTGLTRSKFNLVVFCSETNAYKNFFNMELTNENIKTDKINILEQVKYAINNKHLIDIEYKTTNINKYNNVKPYKILYMNDNYYLATEVDTEYKFSMYRIENIITLNIKETVFSIDPDILEFINNMQTPFSKYRENYQDYLIKVVVEIASEKAKYFKVKNFLPSQEILKVKENGNLLIQYEVTQELEVEDIIKKWIPYIHIHEPLSLKDKILNDLKKYISMDLMSYDKFKVQ
jgi:hypothetical protein